MSREEKAGVTSSNSQQQPLEEILIQQDFLIYWIADKMNWDEEKAFTWLYTSNPFLGGLCPFTMLAIGQGERLFGIVGELLDEN